MDTGSQDQWTSTTSSLPRGARAHVARRRSGSDQGDHEDLRTHRGARARRGGIAHQRTSRPTTTGRATHVMVAGPGLVAAAASCL